jgi:hypothetical protein
MSDETTSPAENQAGFDDKVRARAEMLAGTIGVYRRYDWGDDLLVIDPDDLLVDRPEVPAHDGHPAHPALNKVDFERFVNEAYIGRVLARGDALLEGEVALDLRQELQDCLVTIEDLAVPAHVIGFHVGILAEATHKAKAIREKRDAAESVTAAALETVESLIAAAEGDVEARTEGVVALGDAAWPALEAIVARETLDPAAVGVVKAAARLGGARAIRLTVNALERVPADSDLARTGVATLGELGEDASWSIIGRLHYEGLTPEGRRTMLEAALDTEDPLAVTLVIHEALQAISGERDDVDVDYGLGLARMLVERGDRRAVPLMAFVLKGGDIPKDAHDSLVATLQEHDLWPDVSEVLASFKTEWPLVLPSGVTYEAFAGHVAEREGIDVKDEDARNTFLEKAQKHWERTYREDLGYLRTCDADQAGPMEQKLMRQFTAEASYLAQDAKGQERMQARIENFRNEWMRTPLRSLDGGLPIVAILEERITQQPGGMGRTRARRTILARTLSEARQHLAGKRTRRAKASMAVLDALAPDYAPAMRFRKELE